MTAFVKNPCRFPNSFLMQRLQGPYLLLIYAQNRRGYPAFGEKDRSKGAVTGLRFV